MTFLKHSVAICLLLLLVTAGFAIAEQNRSASDALTPRERLLELLIKLEITDSQKTQIAQTLKAHRDAVREKVDAVRQAHRELGIALQQDQYDEEAVRRAYGELSAPGEELAVEAAQLISQLRSELTEKQKKLLAETRVDRLERVDTRIVFARTVFDHWVDKHAGE